MKIINLKKNQKNCLKFSFFVLVVHIFVGRRQLLIVLQHLEGIGVEAPLVEKVLHRVTGIRNTVHLGHRVLEPKDTVWEIMGVKLLWERHN